MDGAFLTISYDPEFVGDPSVFVLVETVYDDALYSSAAVCSVHDQNCAHCGLLSCLSFPLGISVPKLSWPEEMRKLVFSTVSVVYENSVS